MASTDLTLPRGPAWSNHYALAPLTNKQSHADGTLSDDERRWLVARAEGGFGLVMTCATYVSQAGQAWGGQLGISDDEHVPGLRRLAEELRAAGAVSSVQLHHGGRRADAEVSGVPVRAPWDDESTGASALSTDEVQQAVADFTAGAVRAEAAGFDGVELHGAHGYLIGQFLDGRSNHRTDGYGGSLEDRSRFLREVLAGVRGATGPDFQVGLRLTPERMGITLGEFRDVAAQVMASGELDYLDVSMWDVRKAPHESDAFEGRLVDHVVDLPRHGVRLGVPARSTPPPTPPGASSRAPTSRWSAPVRSCTTTSPRSPRPTPASWRPGTRSRASTWPRSRSARRSWTTSRRTGTTSSPEP